jgi:N-acetyl-gamma-glutamyl-phosphate reductase
VAEGAVDTVVSCLPHGAWRELATGFEEAAGACGAALRFVDLSGDHRDGAAGYVYGLPEAFRAVIPSAVRLANPGCYPTAALLALLPALEGGWLGGPVTVSALSGVSGAGRAATLRTSFVEREGGAELYRAGDEHPHVAEMARTMTRIAGGEVEVGFAPQIVPMARGILLVANAALAAPLTPDEARTAYVERYAGEPFVRVLPPGRWPETRSVARSNRCDVAVTTLHGGRLLLVSSALDNLVKGAAGQAIQNLNLMLGWPEAIALPADGSPW